MGTAKWTLFHCTGMYQHSLTGAQNDYQTQTCGCGPGWMAEGRSACCFPQDRSTITAEQRGGSRGGSRSVHSRGRVACRSRYGVGIRSSTSCERKSGRYKAVVPFTYSERQVVQRGLPPRLVAGALVICLALSLVHCSGALFGN
jgi:hypothetical protein